MALATALTILAFLFVWTALVGPDQPIQFRLSAFLRLPLEGFILVAAVGRAPRARRVMIWVIGPLIGLVILLKILNIGFFAAFDRPFDPYQDSGYTGIGVETLKASLGQTDATVILVVLGLLLISVPVLATLALRRVTRIAAQHRTWTLRAVAGLGALWLLFWAFGAQLVSQTPIASASSASLLIGEVSMLRADLRDHAVFAKEISHDPVAATPADQLLTGLRGKDVLLVFVESYGQVAVQGLLHRPRDRCESWPGGTKQLQAAGLLRAERLPDLTDVRRDQLAGPLHHGVGPLGQHPTALRPTPGEPAVHAQRRVQPRRLAERRRRPVGQPCLAPRHDLLPLRQALQPEERRLPRSDVRLRIDA